MKPVFTATQGRILRALVLFLCKDGEFSASTVDAILIEAFVSQDWASLTFAGERHHLVLRVPAATTGDIDLDAIKIDLPGSRLILMPSRSTCQAASSRSNRRFGKRPSRG